MPEFVNLGPAVDVYRPAGDPDSLHVDEGQTITVPGDITAELDDAYIVGKGDDARSWSKSRWQLKVPDTKPSKQPKAVDQSAAVPVAEGTN